MRAFWLCGLAVFSLNVSAQNINDLIRNHDVQIGDTESKLVSRKNANYAETINNKYLESFETAKGAKFNLFDKYKIEVKRDQNFKVSRVSEAVALDSSEFGKMASVNTMSFSEDGRLQSLTDCSSDYREQAAFTALIKKREQDTRCITYTEPMCARLHAQVRNNRVLKKMSVDELKNCMDSFAVIYDVWSETQIGMLKDKDYMSLAKAEKNHAQEFVDKTVKSLGSGRVVFSYWNEQDLAAQQLKESGKVMDGILAVSKFGKIVQRCGDLQPYFSKNAKKSNSPAPQKIDL